jgi:hypothetical protein
MASPSGRKANVGQVISGILHSAAVTGYGRCDGDCLRWQGKCSTPLSRFPLRKMLGSECRRAVSAADR